MNDNNNSSTSSSNFLHLIPDNRDYSVQQIQNMMEYFSTLSELELKACKIAKEHLQTSYDIFKSNGYKDWEKEKAAAAAAAAAAKAAAVDT